MAPTATVYVLELDLSDVDRGVYETMELRVAQHPSENLRYLVTRTLAYCLSYEPGIAFSKGGLSSADEPPVATWSADGRMTHWIDVGLPSAERLHKASKLAGQVSIYSSAELAQLRRAAGERAIHRVDDIAVWRLDPYVLSQVESKLARRTKLGVVRNEERLYIEIGGGTLESACVRERLVE